MPGKNEQGRVAIPEPTPEQLQAAVEQIRGVTAKLVGLYVAVGKIVLDGFYGGDFERWNRRNRGESTLVRLEQACQAAGLDWSATALYRAVRLYEQSQSLDGLQAWPGLLLNHFVAVQGLPWEAQKRLLDDASARKLTGNDLEAQASAERRKGKPAPERRENHLAEAKAALARLDRTLEGRMELVADLTALGLPEEPIARCTRALYDALTEVRSMQEAVGRLKSE